MSGTKFFPYPEPKDRIPLYINDPSFIDSSFYTMEEVLNSSNEPDNIRVYATLDLNRVAILRRLDTVIDKYGFASEENENHFSLEVDAILKQLDVYDRIHFIRHKEHGRHSSEGIDLAAKIIDKLSQIPDMCSECFPMETIANLQTEYYLNSQ